MLKKYESSKEFREGSTNRRPQFVIKDSPFAGDYYDETNYQKREDINQALIYLSKRGILEVKWVRFRLNDLAEKVYFNTNMIQMAYEIAGIQPKEDKIQRIRDILFPISAHPWPWVRHWQQEVDNILMQRKTGKIDLDKHDDYRDLVSVLEALPTMPDGTTFRVFSQKVFGDSKRFERNVKNRLLGLLKKHYGEDEFEIDEEYLDLVGLVPNPRLARFSGGAELVINGNLINLQTIPEGLVLTSAAINEMEIKKIKASRILCVENLTSYYDLINSRDALIIYIGGFPHKGTQGLLNKIKNCLEGSEIKVFHTGDFDCGGFKIFKYLKENYFPDLKPYLMDISTYESNLELGTSFSEDYSNKLVALLENPQYSAWDQLIRTMLRHKIKIEQEVIVLKQVGSGLHGCIEE